MKILFYIFLILFSINSVFSQNKAVDAIINKYSDNDGFKAVSMNDPAVMIAQNESGNAAEVAKNMLEGIKTVKTISYKGSGGKLSDQGKNFISEIEKFSPGDNFNEIMSLNEGKSKIRSLIRKSGDKVNEFVMIVSSDTESTLIWLNGDINLKNVSNIGKILLQLRGNKSSK